MNNVRPSHRGSALLLDHCARVERMTSERRSARERLEEELGDDLTRVLIGALSGDHRLRPRAGFLP